MSEIVIAVETAIETDVKGLLEESDRYHAELYPAESNHLLDISELERLEMTFFVARIDGKAVACGGYTNHGDYGEIKRMFVSASGRGQKLGRRLLQKIEEHASNQGLSHLRLETGIHQPEAHGLYRTGGYQDIPPFGNYTPDPLSLFMEKEL